jgi:endonuclease YncB( thermonuclease family)
MPLQDRINPHRPTYRGSPFGRRFSGLLPWMFVVGVVLAIVLPFRHGMQWPGPHTADGRTGDSGVVLQRAGNADVHHPVDVIRTIDGDTFLARVHFAEGGDVVTRVRLRGIDAPELKASCQDELTKAEAATDALHALLGQGGVSIFNIGPDKYQGRVVADVATKRTANVSAALLAGGYARSYNGGHREGWCARGWRFWQ